MSPLLRPASVFASLLALAGLRAHASAQTPPTFPAGVDLVRIDVVVLDHGTPVTGLAAGDFEVTENGRPLEIVSFEPIVVRVAPKARAPESAAPARVSEPIVRGPEENRYFLIFFDDVHLTAPAAQQTRAQLVRFLERETRAGDWVTVVSPLAGVKWTARTAFEHQQLLAVIQGLKGVLVRDPFRDKTSEFDAMQTVEYGGRAYTPPPGPNATFHASPALVAHERYELAKRQARQSLGGLDDAIQSLAGFRGRKSLILYSEGFIRSPSMSDYDRTIELARRAHVAVYFADPRGLRSGLDTPEVDRPTQPIGANALIQLDTEAAGTAYVATATGGRSSISNDATALFHDAMVESSVYYLLGFQSSPGEPGERKLKVRVRREGLTVRAPDRYIAGAPDTPGTPLPPAVHALGLVSDAADIPVRVSTLFLDSTPAGEVTTNVAVELGRDAAGAGQHPLNLLIEARPLERGEPLFDSSELSLPAGAGPAVATRELRLRPGVWQARIVVRDPGSERLGSLLHTFEVPSATGLRLSSPILTDELEPSRTPRPRLHLDRRYRTGGALYCQYRVFGAAKDATTGKPRVSASYAIRRAGQMIKEGAPSAIEPAGDGTLLRFLGFGLAGFEPGDYTLVLRVNDGVSGQSSETNEPFTIIPAEG
jgi:VWFA-related protein